MSALPFLSARPGRARRSRARRSRGRSRTRPTGSSTSRWLGKLEVRGPAVGDLGRGRRRCCSSRRRARSSSAPSGGRAVRADPARRVPASSSTSPARSPASRSSRSRDADAPPHRPRPRSLCRPRASSRASQAFVTRATASSGSSSRRSTATTVVERRASTGGGPRVKDLFRVAPHVARARRAEEALRRRDRRRRLARPRDRVLPGEEPRHPDVAVLEQSYIGSGAAGRNTTIIRSNYRTPEGARVLRGEREALRGPRRRPRLQPALLAAGPPHARALRAGARSTMTERAEVNQLLGIDSRLIGLDEIAKLCPRARPLRPPDLAGHGRALPPARRDHPPRRGRLGLRARRRPRAASSSTRTPR